MVKPAGKGSKGSPSRGGGRGQVRRGAPSSPVAAGRGGLSSGTPSRQSPRRGSSTSFQSRSATRRPLSLGAPSRMPASGVAEARGTVAALGVAGNKYYNLAASSSGGGGGGSGSNTNLLPPSTVCPICGRDMRHPKALYGHMRWHSTGRGTPAGEDQEDGNDDQVVEAQTSATTTPMAAISGPAGPPPENDREEGEIVEGSNTTIRNKGFVLPDLNLSPPPEDQE